MYTMDKVLVDLDLVHALADKPGQEATGGAAVFPIGLSKLLFHQALFPGNVQMPEGILQDGPDEKNPPVHEYRESEVETDEKRGVEGVAHIGERPGFDEFASTQASAKLKRPKAKPLGPVPNIRWYGVIKLENGFLQMEGQSSFDNAFRSINDNMLIMLSMPASG